MFARRHACCAWVLGALYVLSPQGTHVTRRRCKGRSCRDFVAARDVVALEATPRIRVGVLLIALTFVVIGVTAARVIPGIVTYLPILRRKRRD